jgi:hypothetical protein
MRRKSANWLINSPVDTFLAPGAAYTRTAIVPASNATALISSPQTTITPIRRIIFFKSNNSWPAIPIEFGSSANGTQTNRLPHCYAHPSFIAVAPGKLQPIRTTARPSPTVLPFFRGRSSTVACVMTKVIRSGRSGICGDGNWLATVGA